MPSSFLRYVKATPSGQFGGPVPTRAIPLAIVATPRTSPSITLTEPESEEADPPKTLKYPTDDLLSHAADYHDFPQDHGGPGSFLRFVVVVLTCILVVLLCIPYLLRRLLATMVRTACMGFFVINLPEV